LHPASRSNVLFSLLLTSALSFQACTRKQERSRAPNAQSAAASQSLASMKADTVKLQAETAAIHKRIEALGSLGDDLPGLAAFRSKLFATEEVLGGVGSTVEWLSGEQATALAAGDSRRLETVAATIARSTEEMKKFESSIVELSHELIPFERTIAQFRAMADAGVFFTRVLPTDYRVNAANDGLEQKLLELISDRKKAAHGSWLPFDRLWFTAGGGALDVGQSSEQLENVAEILKAYPDVKLEIGGYNDDGAPAASARELPRTRAQAVKDSLVSRGIAASRLKAAALGKPQPRCTMSAEECRVNQPRVAARATAL